MGQDLAMVRNITAVIDHSKFGIRSTNIDSNGILL